MTEKINCGECNDTGIIGYPPDQYAQCDCAAPGGQAAQGGAELGSKTVETRMDTGSRCGAELDAGA